MIARPLVFVVIVVTVLAINGNALLDFIVESNVFLFTLIWRD